MTGERNLDLLSGVSVRVSAEIGSAKLTIADVLKLGTGSLVALDRCAAEPVDLLVNGKCVARGEIVAIDDCYGVRITELVGRS